jgi:hypothetical protein
MAELDYVTMATFAFFTGLGTTFGAELAKTLFNKVSGWVEKRGKTVAVKN